MKTWNLNQEIYTFQALREEIPLTIGQLCEGTAIFGGTGSGKTSGPLTAIPLAMLRAGFGGLVLCAKADETERFTELAKKAGREEDLIFFNPANDWRYNFLDDAMQSSGVEGTIELFDQVSQAIGGGEGEGDVWDKASKQLLRNVLALLQIAKRPIKISEIYKACVDIEIQDGLIALAKLTVEPSQIEDLSVVEAYITNEMRKMGDQTKASVLMNTTATLDPFLRGEIRELFCTTTDVTPRKCREGKIVVVDLPIKTYKKLGSAAAAVWKFAFQRTMEEFFGEDGLKKSTDATRPCFLVADECHYFATSYDATFQTTARGARACSVYATQNLPTLHLAGGRRGKELAQSLLGNLQTKILCQNACPETYKWFTEVLGKELQERTGQSANFAQHGAGMGGGGANVNVQRDVLLDARDFQMLARGGPGFRKVVNGILQQAGRTFAGSTHKRKLWTLVSFQQVDF